MYYLFFLVYYTSFKFVTFEMKFILCVRKEFKYIQQNLIKIHLLNYISCGSSNGCYISH